MVERFCQLLIAAALILIFISWPTFTLTELPSLLPCLPQLLNEETLVQFSKHRLHLNNCLSHRIGFNSLSNILAGVGCDKVDTVGGKNNL